MLEHRRRLIGGELYICSYGEAVIQCGCFAVPHVPAHNPSPRSVNKSNKPIRSPGETVVVSYFGLSLGPYEEGMVLLLIP